MHRYLKARLLASALVLAGLPAAIPAMPAAAQLNVSVSFSYFHDRLSDYGDWLYSPRWGRVWRPDADADFRPYTNGYWVYTDAYGWYWVSDDPFGDIAYHYGRWVFDPDDGWLWIPGYVWGPGWVVWRSGGDYTGWMPMPPTEAFLEGDETSYYVPDDYDYGYRRWYPNYSNTAFASLWIFVGNRYVGDRHYYRYAIGRPRFSNIFHRTRNVTNYTIVNNYVVNRSIDVNWIRRAGGRVERVSAQSVIKRPELVLRADRGREIQRQMRREAPHGKGFANSAPPPTPQVIETLSPRIRTKPGARQPANLFTREKVQEMRAQKQPAATPKPETGRQENAPQQGGETMRNRMERLREQRNAPASTPPAGQPKPPETPTREQINRPVVPERTPAESNLPSAPAPERSPAMRQMQQGNQERERPREQRQEMIRQQRVVPERINPMREEAKPPQMKESVQAPSRSAPPANAEPRQIQQGRERIERSRENRKDNDEKKEERKQSE